VGQRMGDRGTWGKKRMWPDIMVNEFVWFHDDAGKKEVWKKEGGQRKKLLTWGVERTFVNRRSISGPGEARRGWGGVTDRKQRRHKGEKPPSIERRAGQCQETETHSKRKNKGRLRQSKMGHFVMIMENTQAYRARRAVQKEDFKKL